MRQFLIILFVILVAWVLILFPSATKNSTADPLPKGLPSWFKEIDKDHDGQVSLPEWLLSGKKLDDFRHFDLNGDGFITPEEVLRVLKKVQHLNLEHGRVNFDGAIEEATDERYQGKRTFKVFTIKLEE
jgi:Ca2+-binding EF-hand superfamily protein